MKATEEIGRTGAWHFWVDRGGTFTDIVALSPSGAWLVRKLLSRSDQYQDAVVEGIRRLRETDPQSPVGEIRLGTTVATNAFLEKKGSPTALITTFGFADLLEIRQQNRPKLFDLHIRKTAPLYQIATDVYERTGSDGEIEIPLDEEIARFELRRLKELGIRSLAIAFLHSTVNPQNELKMAEIAQEFDFEYISLSHQISSQQKIIGRAETAVVDAYLSPRLSRYTDQLASDLDFDRLLFMQSHGGLTKKQEFKGHNALLSGPAGGLIGAVQSCKEQGIEKLIAFDMGGTSTDVAIFDGTYQFDWQPEFHGLSLQVPMLDIHTVAAGGGSILKFDGERLMVGPESAGADPGPTCYRKGGPLTVTDANLLLGRIDMDEFPKIFGPQQDQSLDLKVVREKFEKLAQRMGEPAEKVAQDFLEVAVETMANAVRKISVEKGHDPRDFTLCCFGGAGAQVACRVADRLGMKKVFVHPLSSVLSAFGMGLAEERYQETFSVGRPLTEVDEQDLQARLKERFQGLHRHFHESSSGLRSSATYQLKMAGSDHLIEVGARSLKEAESRFREKYQRVFGLPAEGTIQLDAVTAQLSEKRELPCFQQSLEQPPAMEKEQQGPQKIQGFHTTLFIDDGWSATSTANGAWILNRHSLSSKKNSLSSSALLEIFYQRFQSIAEEMGHVLQHTGYSVNIKERLDYSCAIFTKEGELVANAPHMPVHLGSMSECVASVLGQFGPNLQEGDCYISNAPSDGGTHLPDITLVSPVFFNGELTFLVASRGHHADVGGISPGSMPGHSTRLQEEGVILKTQKLVDGGRFLEEEIKTLFLQARYPARNFAQNLHDLKAQLAANVAGIRSLTQLIQESGQQTVEDKAKELLTYTARRLKEALSEFQQGQAMVELEDLRRIQVKISNDDAIQVDFTGTSGHFAGNFNSPPAVTKAAVLYSLRCLIKEGIPLNDGLAKNLQIVLPENSLLNPPDESAVVAGNVETSQAICDVVLAALGVLAHSQGTMNNLSFGNADFQYYETLGGGSGAGPNFNGASGVQVHMTNSLLTDPEVLESRFPVKLRQFSLRHGSGGSGQFSGGHGLLRRLEFAEAMDVNFLSQRREFSPQGLESGGNGLPGSNWLQKAKSGKLETLSACFQSQVNSGDQLLIATPGGGGYGAEEQPIKNLVFAYGSNLDLLQIRQRCPSSQVVGRACLHDHQLIFSRYSEARGGGVADIQKSPNKNVWGMVYQMSDADLKELDRIEGHPKEYLRVSVEVVFDDGSTQQVWAYDVNDKSPFVRPTKEYWWLVYRGAFHLGAPTGYLKQLEETYSLL